MTPKEKAKELIEKYSESVSVYYTEDSVTCMINAPMIIRLRKQCALIGVNEIIDNNSIVLEGEKYYIELNYWEQVKQEIEKL